MDRKVNLVNRTALSKNCRKERLFGNNPGNENEAPGYLTKFIAENMDTRLLKLVPAARTPAIPELTP